MKSIVIIAEAGVNHNGSLELAKKLIDAAANAKVDFVKFQTFVPENLVSKFAPKADYQKTNTAEGESQLKMLSSLALSIDQHIELVKYCKLQNVRFLSTAFDLESIDVLINLGVTIGKIPSGEITNYPYLVKMAQSFKQIILSTGMSSMEEIKDAIEVLLQNGKTKNDIVVLHCNTEYPTPMKDVNLLAMKTIETELGVNIGYSDHTLGIEVPVAAVAMGASVIEKHFTLDKALVGPDHKASLNPKELAGMVEAIRNIELALGTNEKKASDSESKNIVIARKSIVAKVPISKGDVFSEVNITAKRPGNGINPMKWKDVIGQKAKRNFDSDELIEL